MSSFKVILATLALASLISARVISSPCSESEGDQYQKSEGKGNPKKVPVKTQFDEATDRMKEVEPTSKMMRILTTKTEHEETKQVQAEIIPNHPPDSRHKRSYFPYNSEFQMQWPQFKGSSSWSTNVFSVQRPLMLPISGTNKNSKYSYYENVDSQPEGGPSSASKTVTVNQLMVPDQFEETGEEKPVWDITAYRPNTAKASRQSRASKRELTVVFEESGQQEFSEENEIQTAPLTIAGLKGPSKCAWAIVSCCATSSEEVNHRCFREYGCAGPFWDVSPCSKDFTRAAVQNALYFYGTTF